VDSPDADPPRALPPFGVYGLFLLSGAAGLVYEVLWSRHLAHHLGGSYPAVVAVVTAFLGGLAAGATAGGRWASRLRRPLRTYAVLEAAIGLYALLFPILLEACSPLLGWCYRTFGGAPALHTSARFLVAAALLLPPTFAMGATLPVLVRSVVSSGQGILGGTGLLYGLNTLGAAGGAFAAGLWLLPDLGLHGTLLAGASANGAVAILAFLLDAGSAGSTGPVPGAEAPPAPAAAVDPQRRRALLLLAAGSGSAAMLYQLAWTKALILAFGSSVHAFTLVVATFILGLGLGGVLAPLVRARGERLLLALAGIEAFVGLAAALGLHSVAGLALDVIAETPALRGDYGGLLLWQTWRAARVVLLPTLAMGAAFPVLVAALAGDDEGASRSVGRVYGWNTAGTILGSLGGGMLLLPAVGIRGAIVVGAVLHLGLAALLAASALPRRLAPAVAGIALAATAILAFTAPSIPRERLVCGPYLYASTYRSMAESQGRDVDRVLRDHFWDMPYFREGRTATVGVVRRQEGAVFLRINGKTDAGTGDLSTQVLLGQLPAMARPGARSACVVGLATGISAAAVASHGVERLDVVDICPEVVEASRLFDELNGGVTRRPGVRVIVDDGRTHVEHSRETYDILVTEPTNPWIAGVSNLFTVEYFRACRERLSPDGVLAVWLQAYGISKDDFRMIVRTVREVFPGTTVWECAPYVDFVLLAPKDDAADLVARVASAPFPTGDAAASLALGDIRSREALLSTLALGREAAAEFAGAGPLHTDDRLDLEFRTPRGAFGDAGYPVLRARDMDRFLDPSPVLAFGGADPLPLRAALEARRLAREGAGCFRGTDDATFRGWFREALLASPERVASLAARVPPGPRARILADPAAAARPGSADDLLTHLMWAQAIEHLEQALRLCPGHLWPAGRLADVLQARGQDSLRAGDLASAEADLLAAWRLQPANAAIPRWLGKVHLEAAAGDAASPRLAQAVKCLDAALRLSPSFEMALVEKGAALGMMGLDDEAEAAFRAVLAMRPDSVPATANLAQLLVYRHREAEARDLVRRGLEFEPSSGALLELRRSLDASSPR
jgi:spermidine synthase